MGTYAKVNNGIVKRVISANSEFVESYVDNEPGKWVKCSYNTRGGVHYERDENDVIIGPSADQSKALRKNFPGKGWSYIPERDAFVPPKPYPSWVINDETCLWEPPTPIPTDGGQYYWNENTEQWVVVEE